MARQTGDGESRNMVLREMPPKDDWRDYVTFFFACIGIVVAIIGGGLALVALWEVL